MAMSRADALELTLTIWNEARRIELPRLERIDDALRPAPLLRYGASARAAYAAARRGPTVSIPDDAPEIMYELARKAETNHLPLLVRTFRQVLQVEGYNMADPPEEQNPWRWWQLNRLDARQAGLVDSSLKYGVAYARIAVSRDTGEGPVPVVRGYTPRAMTAIYADPDMDEWPIATVHIDGPNGEHLVLTDEDNEYRFALKAGTYRAGASLSTLSADLGSRTLEYVEHRSHDVGLGACPVVRYREMCLLDGEEQLGIVEPMLAIQERIDETSFGQLVTQYTTSFKQRAVLGWVPESEAEELRAGAARIWYLDVDPDKVKIQELQEGNVTWYIESGKSARRDFAAIAQIPAQSLGVDAISNISDATLTGLERAKNQRVGEIAKALGESHEQLLRAFAWIAGDLEAAADHSGEVRWVQRDARTWAATVDGLVKLVQSQILSPESALEFLPDLSDQQVAAARDSGRRTRAAATIAALTQTAGRGTSLSAPVAAALGEATADAAD